MADRYMILKALSDAALEYSSPTHSSPIQVTENPEIKIQKNEGNVEEHVLQEN